MIIDVHAHFVPPALREELAVGMTGFPSVKSFMQDGGLRIAFCGNEPKRPLMGAFSDVEARQKWLAKAGVDKQLVAGWLDMFGYDMPADEGADWSRHLNDHLLRGVAALPFLVPLATVPLHSGTHAASVLAEALDAGHRGAMIGTQPKGTSGVLDDPDLDPFWEMASERGAVIYVHPTFGARDDRLRAYGLVSAVGRIVDTTIAVARLLYSGHLTRYPGVKLVLSHGGAALPMALGRLRQSFATAPGNNADPMEGFSRLYFDTAVYDARTVRFIADMSDVSKVLMGTDQPFAIAEQKPVELVDQCGFTADERAMVLGGNAAKLFGLDRS
jgi:aminocarboxymuconate-semialdehyde decarboxylase